MNNELISAAFQTILENTKDMMFVKDINHVYVAASMPFVKMVGKEKAEDIIGRTDYELFEDKNLAKRYVTDDERLVKVGIDLVNYVEPITEENGKARYGSTSKYILTDESGNVTGILGITRDITKDYVARLHYQQELQYLFELPADTYAVCYIDVDGWRIISQRKQVIHQNSLQLHYTLESFGEAALGSITDKDGKAAKFYGNFTPAALRKIFRSGRSHLDFTYQRKLADGTVHWVQDHIRFLTDVDSGHLCAVFSTKDIDARKQEEQKLLEAAKMDQMTMVLNRETIMEYIRQTLREEKEQIHALFMIDVDNFKVLNDTLGHQVGDEFLIELSKEIKRCFRSSDYVGRIGGDEFFAFMKNVSDISCVEKKADHLLDSIQQVCLGYPIESLSVSIGISLFPELGETLDELYAEADKALYQAKRKGKNQYVFAGK